MNYKPIDKIKLINWWQSLEDNRGDRAMLRRATFIDDILLAPAFFDFLNYIYENQNIDFKNKNFIISHAIVASIVARVKENIEDSKISFAKSLALPKENSDAPVMSQLRFDKLLKSDEPEQFFIRIRRAVDLLKGKVNITSLTNDILLWIYEFYQQDKDPDREKHLAFKWATDYYTTVKK